ncbi:MAG TPA: DUF3488 and transglutaminase-like domain-containing protein [Acidobacteriota bacterium]|jgi:transglutaminase-like putative cysteine protease|nr:DUF3488 and transglutaminase-like domain-containing protein [Acidobacteriota bacterium]
MKFERLFKIASYGLFVSGFLALAFTGAVDLSGVLLYSLVLISSWWWDERKNLLPVQFQNVLMLLYLMFYVVDLFYFSRPVLATVHLVFFVSAIKLFSKKGPRDYLFLYLFSFAQILIATTFTISIIFLVNVFFFLLFAVACLVLHEIFSSKQAFDQIDKSDIFWGAGTFFTNIALLTLLMCGLAVPFFFILPRFQSSFLGSSPRASTLSGFSQHVNLGDIGRIKLNPAVVMRVIVNRPLEQIPLNLKWRGITLANFDGSGWFRGPERHTIVPNASGGYQVGSQPYRAESVLRQIFVIEPGNPSVLFHAPQLLTVSNEIQHLEMDAGDSFSYGKSPYSGAKYTLHSTLVDRDELLAQRMRGQIPQWIARRYLWLPDIDPRIRELALQVTAKDRDIRDKALSIESFLKTSYGYTLNINVPHSADPLAYFLFDARAGHCEFFASAQTVMLRTLGIPARIVNGFQRGEFNNWGNNFIVRESDAHSWVEAYFPGIDWVEFDPTPSAPNAPAFGWMAGLGHFFDAIDLFWTTEVVTYDVWKQASLFRSIRDNVSNVSGRVDLWSKQWRRALENFWTSWKSQPWTVPDLSLVWIAAALAAGLLLFRMRLVLLAWLAALLPHSRAKRVEDLLVSRIYLRFLRKLEARGFSRKRGETARELVERIESTDLHASASKFAELYYRLRYKPGMENNVRDLMMVLDEI